MKDLLQQVAAKRYLDMWKVGALFMDAGTGKTKIAIDIVNASPCDFVLWVTPLGTIRTNNIQDEVQKQGGFKMPVKYVGIESIGQSDRIFLQVEDELRKHCTPFIVVDESLKIKNIGAKRTQRILQLSKLAEYKLILNGTPLSRNILDLWAQMEFLSPKILGMSFRQYKNTFCKYHIIDKRNGLVHYRQEYITGYANIDYLYSLIRHYVYNADLRLSIAQKYHDVGYNVDEESREEYDRWKGYFLDMDILELRNNNIFFAMTQKMQHAYCCTPQKFEAVDAILKDVAPDKTLIYCKYIKSANECERRFPKCRVLSYQKHALGLNLQQYNTTIFFDKIWDYALRTQSENRTYRTGQADDCVYYDLTGNVGLESLIDRNIQKKISMTEYFKIVSKKELQETL